MTTTIHVVGTIATEPKLIQTASGTQLCSFRLASDERRYDKEAQSWVDPGANWFGIVAFRMLAVHAHESLHKGDRVMVSGKLRMRNWEKEERRGVSVEIEADSLGHDVRWGVSSFDKRVRARTEPTDPADAEANDATLTERAEAEALLSDNAEMTDSTVSPGEAEGRTTETDSPESIGWVSAA